MWKRLILRGRLRSDHSAGMTLRLTLTWAPFEGITRSFTSFSQAARESADARVYAGIHFRRACEDGRSWTPGGQRTATIYLQPARK